MTNLPWVMRQSWLDVLFAHWPVPAERMRALVPAALDLDVRDGDAWVSVTPFEIAGARARGLPPLPGVSRFAELNVRTYVTVGGRPGIFFFSLDAASAAAVAGARLLYRLPYFHARMRVERAEGSIGYTSERDDPRGAPAGLTARYGPGGDVATPAPGSLDAWLVERYRLYTVTGSWILAADIEHAPWPLQPAAAELAAEQMLAPLGLAPAEAPLIHYARRQDVLIGPPVVVRLSRRGGARRARSA